MKLYVLCTGYYYEEYPVAVFDEEHMADGERYAEWTQGILTDGLELNQFKCPTPPPEIAFVLEMKQGGQIVSCLERSSILETREGFVVMSQKYSVKQTKRRWRLHLQCFAKNKEDFIVKANELRLKILSGTIPQSGIL